MFSRALPLITMPRWFQGPRCANAVRLDGKVAVVTGGNTGIGKLLDNLQLLLLKIIPLLLLFRQGNCSRT